MKKMAFERCQKISFQESLEAIKERMKEKRNQNQTKINRAKQTLNSKVKTKVLSKSSFIKNIQGNNQNLALSLEAEKKKLRVAYNVILSLKRERQAMMFYILMLKRKLENHIPGHLENLRLVAHSIGEDLSNFEENDLPHDLPESSSPVEPFIQDIERHVPLENARNHTIGNAEYTTTVGSRAVLSNMMDTQPASKKISRGRRSTFNQSQDSDANLVPPLDDTSFEGVDVVPKGVSIRRRSGRKSTSFYGQIDTFDFFNTFENYSEVSWASEEQKFEMNFKALENLTDSLSSNQGADTRSTELDQVQMTNNLDPEKVKTKFKSNVRNTEVVNSENAQRVKPISEKGEDAQLEVEQRGRRGKVNNGNRSMPLKKHLEPARPGARSKSRDRSQSKRSTAKERKKSLDCSDTYNFDYEESIHLTPFRRKDEPSAGENVEDAKNSVDTESNSEEDLDDSLYVPPADKRRRKSSSCSQHKSEGPTGLTTRPRSRRRTVTLQKKVPHKEAPESGDEAETTQNEMASSELKTPECDKTNECENSKTSGKDIQLQIESGYESENISTVKHKKIENFQNSEESSTVKYHKPVLKKCLLLHQEQGKENSGRNAMVKNERNLKATGENFGPRLSLNDVTNCSSLPTENKEKKMSCSTLLEKLDKISPIAISKRRCTMTVNYKEPSLSVKLRRGDRYTDTKFLRSPIFKQKKNDASRRKSGKKPSPLSRYNEAFVGCR
ncbi:shugoshin 1-like [Heptranchias perlo]|uniref:shugoshin 1-like n=1 Tax=Heptranchias perlo TaxID=212740 RepID=UPI003559ECA1